MTITWLSNSTTKTYNKEIIGGAIVTWCRGHLFFKTTVIFNINPQWYANSYVMAHPYIVHPVCHIMQVMLQILLNDIRNT